MNLRPPLPHSGKYNTALGSTEPYAGEPRRLPQIGYIVKMFPRLSETFIRNEILELERQGLCLRIFSLKRPAESEARIAVGGVQAQVTYLPDHPWQEPLRVLVAQLGVLVHYPRGYVRTLAHVLRGRELRSMGRGLRRFCQTCCLVHEMGEVQHLHAHFATDPTRLASWAQMICQISFSVTTHAKDLYQDHRIGSPGLRYKLNRACFVVANSQFSAAGLRAGFNGEARPNLLTIYNGIDLSAWPPRQEEPGDPLILSVGRLVEKKGFQDLLKACRLLKDAGVRCNCEIIGSGPLGKELQNMVSHLGLDGMVRFRGQMPQQEARAYYLKATVFALSCIVAENGDRDILPNALKEAMATGVPVVTTRLEGIEELVTDQETGLLVAASDPDALAQAIARLLAQPELRRRLATHARKVIEERFDLERNFTTLRTLLLDSIRAAGDRRLPVPTDETARPFASFF